MTTKSALTLCLAGSIAAAATTHASPNLIRIEEAQPASTLEVHNNHSFGVRELVRFPIDLPERDGDPMAVSQSVAGGAIEVHYLPVQVEEQDGRTYGWLDLQLRPDESRDYQFERFASGRESQPLEASVVRSFDSGLPAAIAGSEDEETALFDLALIETTDDLGGFPDNRTDRIRSLLASASVGEFSLSEEDAGPVFRRLVFTGELEAVNRYGVEVTYTFSTAGTADVTIVIEPLEVREETAYMALAKRIPAKADQRGLARWKGESLALEPGEASPERTNRMHSWGRDVNWLALHEEGEPAAFALLADFTPNLTRRHNERYWIANDYLVNELIVSDDEQWWMVAEIARENQMDNYVPDSFVVPGEGERVRLEYRALPAGRTPAEEIDQVFIGFAGYQGATESDEALRLDFGVEGVSFGTSYFPHATFGEHFEHWRTGGQQGESWWPQFGANWRHFKDEIRRDLRIANALGMDWIRIHHFNAPDFREPYLESDAGHWMLDYLEFMAEETVNAGMKLFLDFSLSPEDAHLVAERFGEAIGYYELQNEVLLQGAFLDRIDYWNAVRDAIREAQPDAPVFLSGGPQFFSLYDRLEELGFSSDAIAQHAYVDSRQAPSYVRDIALSLGSLATARGKFPLNSEFNWRTITREPEEAQAEHFWDITNDLLSQRGVPLLLQFQFQETLAIAPRIRGAGRHNELLRLDRTPKPQAWAYADLVRRYGKPDGRAQQIGARVSPVRIEAGGEATYRAQVANLSNSPLELVITADLPPALHSPESETIEVTLRPRQSHQWERTLSAGEDLPPGYHHFFERIDLGDRVHFGWAAAINTAAPELDLDTPPLDDVHYEGGLELLEEAALHEVEWLVFGEDAPALEVDWTFYLYNTLRSATGSSARRMADSEADDERKATNLLLVGSRDSNALIAEIAGSLPFALDEFPAGHGGIALIDNPFDGDKRVLVVTGRDAQGVERAASDLLLRYWRHAKDAASFREGMPPVESEWLETESGMRP